MIVIRGLYGLKSSIKAWRAMLSKTILDIDYKFPRAYLDVWMNPNINPQTGKE